MDDKLIWSIIEPAAWPLWALAAGLGFWRFRPEWSRRLWLAGLLWAVLIACTGLGSLLLTPLEQAYQRPASLDGVAGAVVLTGGERPEASGSTGLPEFTDASERVTTAFGLLAQRPQLQLIVAGGVRRAGQPSDLEVIAQLAGQLAVDRSRLHFVGQTVDTCANARGVAASPAYQAHRGRWLLITSASHMPRAMACFARAGVAVTPYPVDYRARFVPWWQAVAGGRVAQNVDRFQTATYEWAALLRDWLLTRLG